MFLSKPKVALCLTLAMTLLAGKCGTDLHAAELTGGELLSQSAQQDQHTYLLFYRSNDQRTRMMEQTIKTHVDQNAEQATLHKVNLANKAEQAIVEKFDAKRMAVPSVVCVAPNGAVTCVYNRSVSNAQLKRSLLTAKYAEVVLALQNGKIAVVSLVPDEKSQPLESAGKFVTSVEFADRVKHVKVSADDTSEQEFFTRMKVDPNFDASKVILFAPPGRYLGTFDASVSAATLAQKVHNSGGCNCDKCLKKKN